MNNALARGGLLPHEQVAEASKRLGELRSTLGLAEAESDDSLAAALRGELEQLEAARVEVDESLGDYDDRDEPHGVRW